MGLKFLVINSKVSEILQQVVKGFEINGSSRKKKQNNVFKNNKFLLFYFKAFLRFPIVGVKIFVTKRSEEVNIGGTTHYVLSVDFFSSKK